MSKRIPLYLSIEDLETLKSWHGWADGHGMDTNSNDELLIEIINNEIELNKEP